MRDSDVDEDADEGAEREMGLLCMNRKRRGGDEMGCAEAMRELKGMLCVEMKEVVAVCGAETDVNKKRRWCCCREGEENRWG